MNERVGALQAMFGNEDVPFFVEFTRETLSLYRNTETMVSIEMIRLFLKFLPTSDTIPPMTKVLPTVFREEDKE
jgi:hypothetical protein